VLKLSKKIYTYKNRNYEVYTAPESMLHGIMARVHVYEIIRPNWPIFRTKLVDDAIFWVSEFSSIEEGEKFCFKKIIEEQEEQESIYKKWAEFDKN
jgi:hypothetical protein